MICHLPLSKPPRPFLLHPRAGQRSGVSRLIRSQDKGRQFKWNGGSAAGRAMAIPRHPNFGLECRKLSDAVLMVPPLRFRLGPRDSGPARPAAARAATRSERRRERKVIKD